MTIDESTGSKNIKVQIVSQKEFDGMSESRQLFTLELVKKGQVQIVSEMVNKLPKEPERERRSPFSLLRDKEVLLTLNNGETIEGLLTDVWQYEVALQLKDKSSLLILKHAIMMIRLLL